MTASEFNNLIKIFPSSDASASALLEDEILHASYCQSFYVLLARIKQDQHDDSTSVMVQQAAVHSADRTHLKKILEQTGSSALHQSIKIENNESPGVKSNESVTREIPEQAAETVTNSVDNPISERTKPGRHIADEVEDDILILKEKVKQFSELTTKNKKPLDRFLDQNFERSIKDEKSIREEKPEKPIITSRGPKAQDETDLLLNDIKSSRKKVKPDNTRQAEQLAIIDQFIKSNLVTIKPPEKGNRKQDLTETSESYSENVISETLVDILIRQGKKDKAIDVLKKLIWKFPQKKHLFAARIQELSK